MYRTLIVLAVFVSPVLGQMSQAEKTERMAFASFAFGGVIEDNPFRARYISERIWMSDAGRYSDTDNGSLFRDSRGRLSRKADRDAQCDPIQGCDWIQDPVTDTLFRGHFVPNGKPWIDP